MISKTEIQIQNEIAMLKQNLENEIKKNYQEFTKGLKQGEQKGIALGRSREKVDMVKRLDNLNMTEYQISRATGLSQKIVREIISKNYV